MSGNWKACKIIDDWHVYRREHVSLLDVFIYYESWWIFVKVVLYSNFI